MVDLKELDGVSARMEAARQVSLGKSVVLALLSGLCAAVIGGMAYAAVLFVRWSGMRLEAVGAICLVAIAVKFYGDARRQMAQQQMLKVVEEETERVRKLVEAVKAQRPVPFAVDVSPDPLDLKAERANRVSPMRNRPTPADKVDPAVDH